MRDLATRAAATVAARYASKEGEPPPQWLPDVAHDAVDESLAADSDSALDAVKDASSRAALRRRLNGAEGATWVAVALHHLAGYSISDTATLMTYDEQAVAELCGPFDPPPGEQWADLGDPTLRAGDRVSRDPRGRRRIPVFPLVAVVLVAGLAIWAATSIGDRPTVTRDTAGAAADDGVAETGGAGDGAAPDVTPDDSGTAFSPALDPLASAGCREHRHDRGHRDPRADRR